MPIKLQLIHGDCTIEMTKIKDKSVDLILTDPPYLISRDTTFTNGGDTSKYGSFSMDFGKWDKNHIELSLLFAEWKRILKDGGTLIMFYDVFKLQEVSSVAQEYKFKQPRVGIWRKTNAVPVNARVNYLSNCREYFVSFVKGKKTTFNSYYDPAYYEYPIVGGKERTIHPTQKPVRLMEDLIRVNSNKGDIILDCFMGSGSTGVACVNTNRSFIGIELNKEYFDISKDRICQVRKQKS